MISREVLLTSCAPPRARMPLDDAVWYPLVLQGGQRGLTGEFEFDATGAMVRNNVSLR